MTRRDASHRLLLWAWLFFCGSVIAGLLFVIGWVGRHPVNLSLALLVGVAAIPFVWLLSSGWEDADLFRKTLRAHVKDCERRDP